MADGSQNVPKEYLRQPDHQLLPPRVGHDWNDQAFRSNQKRPQQLEAEFRGTRAFAGVTRYDNPFPAPSGNTAQQLVNALASSSRRGRGGGATSTEKRYLSLDDKVLRFYGYFRERAPDGGASEFWHRRVVINFYPVDDTVLIQEPAIPNSGLDGGTFLKRQKVKADPRQREQFPDDEFLTINFFNVGWTVRINAIEFVLYDCDGFTRDFLTTLGVDVGEPYECPDDEFSEALKRHEKILLGAKHGVPAQDVEGDEEERTARFLRDGGTVLRFSGILDERARTDGGAVRKLELLFFVEDGSIAVTERPTTSERTPVTFLARGFLPKSGSLVKANELTFSHRVNGRREPDNGPEGFYQAADLDIGTTVNVLGRPVLLYDCDDFTREFYSQRYGITLQPSRAAEMEATHFTAPQSGRTRTGAGTQTSVRTTTTTTQRKDKDELRFVLRMSRPKNHDEQLRRFTLTFYTDTGDATVFETTSRGQGDESVGRRLYGKQPLPKPVASRGLRNDPAEKLQTTNSTTEGERSMYTEDDLGIGREIVVSGIPMTLTAMDAHTEAHFTGIAAAPPSDETAARLLSELREYLGSRYGTAVKAFLAFDHDRDGVISAGEFQASLRTFQITADPALAARLMSSIAGTGPSSNAETLTTKDLMRWMAEGTEGTTTTTAGARASDSAEAAVAAPPVVAQATKTGDQAASVKAQIMRRRTLHELRERLAARQMSSVGMFRLCSTMPRAYRERSADVHTLFNPSRDAQITPVQLRRCCEEVLGTTLSQEEMSCILSFFFPTMPASQHFRTRDDTLDFAIDLPSFQRYYNEMCRLAMIDEGRSQIASGVVRTSLI